MNKVLNEVNLLLGGVVAILTQIFAPMWILFAGLAAFNVVDWLTGWYYERKMKQESSKIGAKGIAKKVGYWLVICLAFYISYAFQQLGVVLGIDLAFLSFVGWFVLGSYLVNEIRSILENLVKLGVNVPSFMVKGLQITSDLIENAADGKLPKENAGND